MTPWIRYEISRALLASNPMERREGPCFPLEIAALSLNRLRATPLCSENAPPSGVVRQIQGSLIPNGPRSPATCRKWDVLKIFGSRPAGLAIRRGRFPGSTASPQYAPQLAAEGPGGVGVVAQVYRFQHGRSALTEPDVLADSPVVARNNDPRPPLPTPSPLPDRL